jgi:hypothetical protein
VRIRPTLDQSTNHGRIIGREQCRSARFVCCQDKAWILLKQCFNRVQVDLSNRGMEYGCQVFAGVASAREQNHKDQED